MTTKISTLSTSQIRDHCTDEYVVICPDPEDTCYYQREYGAEASQYEPGALRRWPECENCGDELVFEER